MHGHQSQQLHENGDGTFSIVNPETSAPYPGTLGMEKEKPFNCDTCGKRYKNLNGLKYVRPVPSSSFCPLPPLSLSSPLSPSSPSLTFFSLSHLLLPLSHFHSLLRVSHLTCSPQHKSHSLPCNPEFKMQALAAGLTLPGIGENLMMH